MDALDFYDILECAPHSSLADIHTQYYKLAKRHHPDKTEKSALWEKIRAAHEVLGDEKQRALYDRWRASRVPVPFEKYRQTAQAHAVHWSFSGQRAISDSSARQWWEWREQGNRVPDLYERFRNYEI
ncbi:hypothetical protein EC988_005757 [Linderina pennispora]|nr:hypothetical protein EC988_005757 [Linderina pennispora]